MNTFSISWQNQTIEVTQQDKKHFSVKLPQQTLQLELRQDNEGANHWFEAGTDNATETSAELGVAIEAALSDK
ncbi:hypothetical protein [Filimonas effusa]|uniref:Uncharacterized protein n=1 Tax=Filimonas effusa TaxID=2508721 RepID=A0A4Q1D1N7_9BACT|nr:hypothetical protein [Filimonas effusa]RXK81788.1 hypothetical protein ESB13_18525 [Filimonas effusa]